MRCGLLLVGLVVGGASVATAQETGTAVFHSPYRPFLRHELGAAVSFQRGAQTGVEGHYRRGFGQVDAAVRAGLMVREDVQDSFLVGIDVRLPLIAEERFPLRGALVTGVGLDVSGGASVWVPVGLSLGRRLIVEKSAVSIIPYAQPTAYFTTVGTSDVGVGLGLGLDVRLSPGFEVRVGGGFGTDGVPEGVAFSAVWLR